MFMALLLLSPLTASAAFNAEDTENAQTEIYDEINSILDEYDIDKNAAEISDMSFGELVRSVFSSVTDRIFVPVRLLALLFSVIVFSAIAKSMGGGMITNSGSSDLYNIVCTLAAVSVITPSLFTLYQNVLESIQRTGGFMLVFVPVFAGVTIACGGAISGGTYSALILGASELFTALTENYLMPVLSITSAFAVTGSVFGNSSSENIVRLLKKLITWSLTVSMTLFTGFTAMKCTLAGKADGAASKTVKYMMSGFIPIVGGAVTDAYSTVRGSFDLIRSTIGIAGNIAIFLLIAPPLAEILIFRGVLLIASTVASLLSADAPERLLKGLDGGLAIAQSVLICYSVMLIICTGILVQSVG